MDAGEALDIAEEKIEELEARAERYRKALEEIASYGEGPVVTGGFDEPCSARIARRALEEK